MAKYRVKINKMVVYKGIAYKLHQGIVSGLPNGMLDPDLECLEPDHEEPVIEVPDVPKKTPIAPVPEVPMPIEEPIMDTPTPEKPVAPTIDFERILQECGEKKIEKGKKRGNKQYKRA